MTWAGCSSLPVRSVTSTAYLSAILQCRDLRLYATPQAQRALAWAVPAGTVVVPEPVAVTVAVAVPVLVSVAVSAAVSLAQRQRQRCH